MAKKRKKKRSRRLAVNKIRAARDAAKMTQQEAADRAGWKQPYYARIEKKCGRLCSIETFATLARIFDCTVDELMPEGKGPTK